MRRVLGLSVWVLLSAACGSGKSESTRGGREGCSDPDGDGYGVGRDCRAPDCDENNPTIHGCADCEADPTGVGCPCIAGSAPEPCYEGPDGTSVNAPCRAGLRSCADSAWTGCEGQRLPEPETCDGVDDDCDGAVDDGAVNACGTCDEICEELRLGVGGEPWNLAEEGGEGLVLEDGVLTLDRGALLLRHIWIPNHADLTISKVDTRTHDEEGRYLFGPTDPILGANFGGVATNRSGDLVVGAITGDEPHGRITRMNASDCPEGDTSTGTLDVLPWGRDACVIWSVDLPTGGPSWLGSLCGEARAALDGFEEYIWVSDGWGHKVLELTWDGDLTGREVDLGEDLWPQAVTVDPSGQLWVLIDGLPYSIGRIDPVEAELVESFVEPDSSNGGCIVAAHDGTIWIAEGADDPLAESCVFDPVDEAFTCFDITTGGVAAGLDYVWFGGSEGEVYRVSLDGYAVERFDVFASNWLSVAVDGDDWVWAVAINTQRPGTDEIVRFPDALTFPPDDPASFETAVDTLANPAFCGDVTGTQLTYATEIVGSYEHVFEGCEGERATSWHALDWSAFTSGDARIRFEVRTAGTVPELQAADWIPLGEAPADSAPLDVADALVEPAPLLALRITLLANGDDFPPRLDWISVERACGEGPR